METCTYIDGRFAFGYRGSCFHLMTVMWCYAFLWAFEFFSRNHWEVCISLHPCNWLSPALQGPYLPTHTLNTFLVTAERGLETSPICSVFFCCCVKWTAAAVILPLSGHRNSGLSPASLAQREEPADDPTGFAEELSSAELQLLVALVHTRVHLPEVLDGGCV